MNIRGKIARLIAPLFRWELNRMLKNPMVHQERAFKRFLSLIEGTALQEHFKTYSITNLRDLRDRFPVSKYEDYTPLVEKLKEEKSGVYTQEEVKTLLTTSGTSGKPKYVPMTRTAFQAMQRFQRYMFGAYLIDSKAFHLLDGHFLAITAGYQEVYGNHKIPISYSSATMGKRVHPIMKKYMVPCPETHDIVDMEEKFRKTAEEAVTKDIRSIAGVVPWVVAFLKQVQEEYKRPIRRIWPNLQIYIYTGVNITPYEKELRELLGPGVYFMELYHATEGGYGFKLKKEDKGITLIPSDNVYEFRDQDGEKYLMDEIKIGKFYELIVTTPSGLMSYPTGDLLEVVQENPLQVRVAGRIKDTLRIVGEWTGVDSVRRALAEASMKQGIRYQNFIVTPTVTNGEKPGYHCYVEFDQNKLPKESQKFAIDFDEALKRIDYSYQEMRRINALGIPQLSHVRAGTLDHILLEGKHCGQGKYLHLYSSRSILDKIPEKEIS